ncbi:hypothetical protein J3E72DRAFT_387986 [Bipolaris maydis]|nr:hypothetical protein J3E74DRAFT_439547 [Bipolaris maydis]KAJ6194196.1 hypothetical protein J3E72DRAFT_387986 [Bipolaris maydis]KAJ6265233.1 ankyrin [Bipolaris maydis]KAJ6280964.1 ankyrin [Bipolaris maydis]
MREIHELHSINESTTGSSSFDRDFDKRRREDQKHELQSSDVSSNQHGSINATSGINNDALFEEYPLLSCLQLVAHHKVFLFSVSRGRKWNTRERLGHGITFDVEQADLPVREAVSDLQYYDISKGVRHGFITDHTGIRWGYDTVVAYKSLYAQGRMNRKNLFLGLLKELRILCHPPLQKHPYIARFIGLAWIREEDITSEAIDEDADTKEPREWPILITERAELGTIGNFLRYRASCLKPISLLAKVRLLSNVLEAISDLHDCDIIHGDIKSSNVLVYTNFNGTAENWTAKVIDFSHSAILDQQASNMTKRDQLVGTDFYKPPELGKPKATFYGGIADRVDIWCWGMLLWEVLLDGKIDVTTEFMHELRNTGRVAEYACKRCKEYLETHHKDERRMFLAVLKLLDEALLEDPRRRPSAASLIPHVRLLSQHASFNIQSHRKFDRVAPLHTIPFFDLMHQYFGLVDMLYIPGQVVEALTALSISNKANNKPEVDFQLGLCHAVGFGVSIDHKEAIRLFSASATRGFQKARLLLKRIATALNIALDPEIEHLALTWRDESRKGAISENLPRLLFLPSQHSIESITGERHLVQNGNSSINVTTSIRRLVEAIKHREMEEIEALARGCENINQQLDTGETALHYAVLSLDLSIVAILLHFKADVSLCTTTECELSIPGSTENWIPSNVSPISLAVLLDRVDLLETLLEHITREQNGLKHNQTIVNLIAWGAQYQSINCIERLCKQLKCKPEQPFDDLGVNPLSYAVRNDYLFRLVLFTSSSSPTDLKTPPVVSRQHEIVQKLLEVGFPSSANESTELNCLHIAAATSDVALLTLLLDHCKTSDQNALEKISPEGFSPLGVSIVHRRKDLYDVLMEAGAKHYNVWPEMRGDAIHCCTLYPSAESLVIAKEILKKHPRAIKVRDKTGRTPLHCAALRDYDEMIKILIDAGADLSARDMDGYTPLGAAVSWRSVRAIKLICAALKRKRQPLVSWTFTDTIFGFGLLTYSPLEQLLSPGTISPAREPELLLGANRLERFGCCDHPFSQKSLKVLEILLDSYTHTTRLGTNFWEHLFFPMDSYSGTQFAVSMGNIEAVKLLLKSKKFTYDYRYLVLDAHNQRATGQNHITDETTREDMLEFLEEYHDEQFRSRSERRRSSGLSLAWKLYYTCYGNLEQEQWKRANAWLRENRFHQYRPLFLEFVPWVRTRWSLDIVAFSIGWIFMAPMIVYFILIHRVPPTECPRPRLVYTIISLVMVSSEQ